MGFNESTHPGIASKIDARIPSGEDLTEEKEEDVVSEVVDDLLSDASPTPAPAAMRYNLNATGASSSSYRDANILI